MTNPARHNSWPLGSVLLVLLLCTGCICGPDCCRPNTPVPDQWHQQLEEGEYIGSEEVDQWWLTFNDPILNDLIACAGSGNLDLYASLMRIRQARAQVCIARSARLPMLQNSTSFVNQQQSLNGLGLGGGGFPVFLLGPIDLWATSLDLSWEPDIFGRVSRQIESACATTEATVEAYRDVLVLLYSEVAATYVRVRTTQEQIEFALRNVALQERALELTKRRVEAGVSPILDQHQAESNLASTEAQIPSLETQLQQDMNRLAVLLGQYPGAIHACVADPEPIPDVAGLPRTIPCDMVRQRPDIRQAERTLAARCAELGVAIADLYPRFMINGTFGLQSQKLSNLFSSDSWTYSVGPGLTWPIFQGFRIKCNIVAADAAIEEAIANYEQSILRAVEEVENAVVGYHNERRRYEYLQRTVEASELTVESVVASYSAGETNFQNVLDSLRTLFLAQNALAVSEGEIVQLLIQVYRALGGGWDPQHHCHDRCVRVQCPDRSDPSVAKIELTNDPSDRYFGQGSDDDEEEDEDESDEADQDESTEDTPMDTDGDESDSSLESLLDRKVQELEELLQKPPAQQPPDTAGDAEEGFPGAPVTPAVPSQPGELPQMPDSSGDAIEPVPPKRIDELLEEFNKSLESDDQR